MAINLDRRLKLFAPTTTQDNVGQFAKVFTEQAEVWAALNPMVSTERFEAEQLYGYSIVRWVIRHRTDINQKWRLESNNEEFDIIGILYNTRRHYMTIISKLRDNEQRH